MQTFFRSEMTVTSRDATIPSHQKTARLIALLQRDERIQIIGDFPAVAIDAWHGIHEADYVRRFNQLDPAVFEAASIPVSRPMAEAVQYAAGSLVAAAEAALTARCTFSPSAGFHHAHWDHAGPFCLLNAVPLAARRMLNHASVNRVLILDGDFHRGDGTDAILTRMADVRIRHASLGFKFSRRAQSADYLKEIERIAQSIEGATYDFVIYKAGMDVLIGDPAGGGILTHNEARQRDEMVFSACRGGAVPIVWNLAGGYQRLQSGYEAVIHGHLNTVECALNVFPGSAE